MNVLGNDELFLIFSYLTVDELYRYCMTVCSNFYEMSMYAIKCSNETVAVWRNYHNSLRTPADSSKKVNPSVQYFFHPVGLYLTFYFVTKRSETEFLYNLEVKSFWGKTSSFEIILHHSNFRIWVPSYKVVLMHQNQSFLLDFSALLKSSPPGIKLDTSQTPAFKNSSQDPNFYWLLNHSTFHSFGDLTKSLIVHKRKVQSDECVYVKSFSNLKYNKKDLEWLMEDDPSADFFDFGCQIFFERGIMVIIESVTYGLNDCYRPYRTIICDFENNRCSVNKTFYEHLGNTRRILVMNDQVIINTLNNLIFYQWNEDLTKHEPKAQPQDPNRYLFYICPITNRNFYRDVKRVNF